MRTRTIAAALASAAGTASMAQTLEWTRRVDDGTTKHKFEVALAVDRMGSDVMTSWMHGDTGGSMAVVHVYYNVAADGENFRADAIQIPLPSGASPRLGDPMVAFTGDDTGRGWVGALDGFFQDKFWVARKTAQQPYADDPAIQAAFPSQGVDKGLLLAGPPHGGGADEISLVYARTFFEGATSLKRMWALISPDLGLSWNQTNQFPVGPDLNPSGQHFGNRGGPGGALVLRTGTEMRWVVAYRPEVTLPLPLVTYTDNGSVWTNSTNPTSATVPGSSATESISGIAVNHLGTDGTKTVNFPSIAADPNNESIVYMVFSATSASTGSTNADLFIARSSDSGANFSGSPAGSQVLHLTDGILGETGVAHQFMPAITVDYNGAINIAYYVARGTSPSDEVWTYQVKYVRLAGFATAPASPSVVNLDLAPAFNLSASEPGFPSPAFMGDYIGADSRVCTVYAGFVSRLDPTSGPMSVYVSKITSCTCYANCDNSTAAPILNVLDFGCFTNRFASGHPYANCDGSTVAPTLNVNDFQCFLNKFAAGCS